MNTYAKYCPNVFLAKCNEPHEKGEIITLTSKYGNETEVIVHNLVKHQGDFYYYSFTRYDGMNSQTYAANKAERYQQAADNALKRSDRYVQAAQEVSIPLEQGGSFDVYVGSTINKNTVSIPLEQGGVFRRLTK